MRISLDAIEQHPRDSLGASITARTGAVAFIQRFGPALNEHTRIHIVVIDGVFEPDSAQGVRFIAAEADVGVGLHRRATCPKEHDGTALSRPSPERGIDD